MLGLIIFLIGVFIAGISSTLGTQLIGGFTAILAVSITLWIGLAVFLILAIITGYDLSETREVRIYKDKRLHTLAFMLGFALFLLLLPIGFHWILIGLIDPMATTYAELSFTALLMMGLWALSTLVSILRSLIK